MVTVTLKMEGPFICDHKAFLSRKRDHHYRLHFEETERKKVITHLGYLPEAIGKKMDTRFVLGSRRFSSEYSMREAFKAARVKALLIWGCRFDLRASASH